MNVKAVLLTCLLFIVSALGTNSTGCRALIDGSPKLPNSSFTTNSLHTNSDYSPHLARFSSKKGWVPRLIYVGSYLQVDLGVLALITNVATKDYKSRTIRTLTYNLTYSINGLVFYNYSQTFAGNRDANTTVNHTLTWPIYASVIRVYPLTFVSAMALRLEAYGCPVPDPASALRPRNVSVISATPTSVTVGWSRSFTDTAIRHTRCYSAVVEHINATVVHTGYFCFESLSDPRLLFGNLRPSTTYRFTLVAEVQGFNVSDPMSMAISTLAASAQTPVKADTTALTGCQPLIQGNLPDSRFTATSSHYLHFPHNARFNSTGWVASLSAIGEFLQVEIGPALITSVATKGVAMRSSISSASWTTAYNLSFSLNNQDWFNYGQTFGGNIDVSTAVNHTLKRPVLAKFVRVYPLESLSRGALRLELYGCPVSPSAFEPKNLNVMSSGADYVTVGWNTPTIDLIARSFICYSLVVEHINTTVAFEECFCQISVFNVTQRIKRLAPTTLYRLSLTPLLRGHGVAGTVVIAITTTSSSVTPSTKPSTPSGVTSSTSKPSSVITSTTIPVSPVVTSTNVPIAPVVTSTNVPISPVITSNNVPMSSVVTSTTVLPSSIITSSTAYPAFSPPGTPKPISTSHTSKAASTSKTSQSFIPSHTTGHPITGRPTPKSTTRHTKNPTTQPPSPLTNLQNSKSPTDDSGGSWSNRDVVIVVCVFGVLVIFCVVAAVLILLCFMRRYHSLSTAGGTQAALEPALDINNIAYKIDEDEDTHEVYQDVQYDSG